MLARLDEAIQRLLTGELHGREVRLLDGRPVQGWPVPPYRIYYERTASYTRIVRVYHQSRARSNSGATLDARDPVAKVPQLGEGAGQLQKVLIAERALGYRRQH
jgi:hypothetical protein